jgi:2,5-furandicarboxylate decarboxylase 1
MPARAEFLLEGDLEPPGRPDGPFGEISGYYMVFPNTPSLRVRRVSHRESPLYHALLPTGGEGDLITGLTVEAQVAQQARALFPYLKDMTFVPGTFGASVVVTVRPIERARVRSLLHYLLSLDRLKKVVVVPEDVDPDDLQEVEWSIITRCQPDKDVVLVDDLRPHPIDPSAQGGTGGARVGIDATGFGRPGGEGRVGFPPEALSRAKEVLEALNPHGA